LILNTYEASENSFRHQNNIQKGTEQSKRISLPEKVERRDPSEKQKATLIHLSWIAKPVTKAESRHRRHLAIQENNIV
jgi:hypothetical protein